LNRQTFEPPKGRRRSCKPRQQSCKPRRQSCKPRRERVSGETAPNAPSSVVSKPRTITLSLEDKGSKSRPKIRNGPFLPQNRQGSPRGLWSCGPRSRRLTAPKSNGPKVHRPQSPPAPMSTGPVENGRNEGNSREGHFEGGSYSTAPCQRPRFGGFLEHGLEEPAPSKKRPLHGLLSESSKANGRLFWKRPPCRGSRAGAGAKRAPNTPEQRGHRRVVAFRWRALLNPRAS